MESAEVWLIDLAAAGETLERAERETPRLSEECEQRCAAMAAPDARRERRLTHIALRTLLEQRLGLSLRRVPFVRDGAGKPSLPDTETSFSLAHAAGHALIALAARAPVGVDLEAARTVRIPAHRRPGIEALAIALAHGAPLAGDEPDARFLHAWVRLEAVAKARGTGIGRLLETARPRDGATAVAPPSDVIARDLAVPPGLVAAIALPPAHAPPAVRRFPDAHARLATPDNGTRD